MNDFLTAIKTDLLDRRMFPLVAVIAVAFLAAVAYAALGRSSSPNAVPASSSRAPASLAGLTVSPLSPEDAVAETTAGNSLQRTGAKARNPFTPLPEPKSAKSSTAQASSSAPASSSTGSSSSSSSAGSSGASSPSSSSEPAAPSKPTPAPSQPAKPKVAYRVSVLFGEVPAGASQSEQLTPYENLALKTFLPSAKHPLIVLKGVGGGGKTATFTLVSEPILHGKAVCTPSASQCEGFMLHTGQTEQLEYISASGTPVTWELRLVSITPAEASTAGAKALLRRESRAARAGLQLH